MARTPSSATPKTPRRLAKIAAKFRRVKTPVAKPATPRKAGADVKTPVRWRVVTEYHRLLGDRSRLPPAGLQRLQDMFPDQIRSKRVIQKLVKQYRFCAPVSANLSRQRSRCGGGRTKFSEAIAEKLIEINNRHWGRLSCKKLAGRLNEEDIACSSDTVRRWCAVLGAARRHRYIKPMLKLKHKIDRLEWVLRIFDDGTRTWPDCYYTVHGDENCFFLMRDGVPCRVFPTLEENEQGEIEPTILAAIARPRPDHGFDGKVGIWSFTKLRKAKRGNRSTGTVAGETDIVETVTVDAAEYRRVMLTKGGVFDANAPSSGGSNTTLDNLKLVSRFFTSTMEPSPTLQKPTKSFGQAMAHRKVSGSLYALNPLSLLISTAMTWPSSRVYSQTRNWWQKKT